MAARKCRHEPGGVGVAAQRQGGQLQARRPPFGPCRQRRHRSPGQVGPNRLAQQGRGLFQREAHVGGAQFGELPARAQPRQRQRRVGPPGQNQAQALRQVLEQERQRGVHRLGVDQVVVVEDQHYLFLARLGSQLVDQSRHQPLKGPRGRRAEQRASVPGYPRAHRVQRSDDMPPEPRRVVVSGVQ